MSGEYKNTSIYKLFEEICKIPHGSGNEKALADYIEKFAKERGHYTYRDSFDNVFVRREATNGCENKPAVLLQGHTDMVCEKVPGLEFDFLSDAIQTCERDGYLYANGTTLGADDGAAVAIMLAILDDRDFSAPAIECLFTTSEETALVGATNFDYSKVKARRMINIDTECEGEAVAGSAGGVRCRIIRKAQRVSPEDGAEAVKITVGGLKGGHSGTDIALGRTSACVTMAKLLKLLGDKVTVCEIRGGNMDNAISRDAYAVVLTKDIKAVLDTVRDYETTLKAKVTDDDKNVFVTAEKTEVTETMTKELSDATIALSNEINHGVYAMSRDMENLVESSANFASFKEIDGNIIITVSCRSSVAASLASMKESLKEKANAHGFEVSFEGEYPGWQYEPESELITIFKNEYKKLSGVEGRVVAIHAGLECGLIKSAIPDMDIISVGPTINDAHTPNENMEIGSFIRTNDLVRAMINA